MLPNVKRSLTVLALLPLTIFAAACQTAGSPPLERNLPPASSIVLPPAPSADIKAGDDEFVAWKKEEARADDNELRLLMSADNYEAVRRSEAAGAVRHERNR